MTKVWIYQANRRLANQEESGIQEEVDRFLNGWQTHGKPMAAEFEIRHHLFLILKVDDDYQAPSGCAIDKSVSLFKYIGQTYGIELFDRHQFAYEYQGQVFNDRLTNLSQLVQQGYITDETMVYNNLVSSLGELENQFRIPFKDSWHRNMLSQSALMA
jgi:hypothetical protein